MDTGRDILRKFIGLIQDRLDILEVMYDFDQEPLDKKVAFSYSLLDKLNLLPTFNDAASKSTTLAIQRREFGNEAFRQKEDMKALKYYTRSIAVSEPDSDEIAMAYANRSAVLHACGRYTLCISDIERALKAGYPESLKYKLYERKGKCYLEKNNVSEAKRCFMESLSHLKVAQLAKAQHLNVKESLQHSIRLCDEHKERPYIDKIPSFIMPDIASRNSLIPNASSKLEIKYSEEMGRCIFAKEDIDPGEILATEKPFSSILLQENYFTNCAHCFVHCEALIPCSNCSMTMFCGERCREAAWNSYHKIECKMMSYVILLQIEEYDLLTLRTLMIATEQGRALNNLMNDDIFGQPFPEEKVFGVGEKYASSDYKCVHYLEENIKNILVPDLLEKSVIAALLLHGLINSPFFESVEGYDINDDSENKKIKTFVGSLLLKYQYIMLSNAHDILEFVKMVDKPQEISGHFSKIGFALYPLLSLFNHSCNPDIIRHNYHDGVVLRSLQPIAAGQQIFDNYGSLSMCDDFHVREAKLKFRYHFKCKCVACENKWSALDDTSENLTLKNPDSVTEQFIREIMKQLNNVFSVVRVAKKNIIDMTRILELYATYLEVINLFYAIRSNHYVNKKIATETYETMDESEWCLNFVVRNYLRQRNVAYERYEFEAKATNGLVVGFNSRPLFGRIVQRDSEEHPEPLVLKTLSPPKLQSEYADVAFLNELVFYREILPLFASLDPSIYRLFPKFHSSTFSFDSESKQACTVLEDLRESGYRPADGGYRIDNQRLTSMLQTLAEFHAYSYEAKRRHPSRFEYLAKTLKYNQPCVKEEYNRFLSEICNERLKVLDDDPLYGEKVVRVRQLLSNVREFDEWARSDQSPFAVICHGDYLASNVLFASNGVAVIDFGDAHYASPALDLIIVLYLHTNRSSRKHWDQLIDVYYTTLRKTFPDAVPDKCDIMNEFKKRALIAYVIATMFIPLVILFSKYPGIDINTLADPAYRDLNHHTSPTHVMINTWKKMASMVDPEAEQITTDILKDIIDRGFI